ncbi:hypothetical protein ACN38_g13106, partial [Penicillium nordicum]
KSYKRYIKLQIWYLVGRTNNRNGCWAPGTANICQAFNLRVYRKAKKTIGPSPGLNRGPRAIMLWVNPKRESYH